MSYFVSILFVAVFLASCSGRNDDANVFTLASRVSLVEFKACDESLKNGIFVEKKMSDYFVTVVDVFSCKAEINAPYVTLAVDKKATLVIDASKKISGCECKSSATIKISDRLEPGDILYILDDTRVINHIVLP